LDFEAEIYSMNLKALNVLKEYNYNSISGNIIAHSEGFELEKFVGEIILDDITYCSGDTDYRLEHLHLKSTRNGIPAITVESEIVDASIKGYFNLKEIAPGITEIISDIHPSFRTISHQHRTQNFSLNIKIYDVAQVTEVFLPQLKIAKFTNLSIVINEPESYFETILLSDSISYGD